MYSHVMVGSNDIDASKRFYDAVFTAIGYRDWSSDVCSSDLAIPT